MYTYTDIVSGVYCCTCPSLFVLRKLYIPGRSTYAYAVHVATDRFFVRGRREVLLVSDLIKIGILYVVA